ncbi:MAG: AbrB/MazE/SpoVT family DNA-binding domain-containing protein [Bryobacteraceae bacterium]|jgi:AbrB family looped-hinge helix DNA binding protein
MPNVRREAKITSKGQITVPLDIRRVLGVKPGDRLVFETAGENVSVRPIRAPGSFEKYRGIGGAELPTSRRELARYMRELRGR